MGIGSIGTWELIIILFVVLLIFGGKKLPELAKGLGKGISEFRKAAADVKEELDPGRIEPSTPAGEESTEAKGEGEGEGEGKKAS